jgi:hypothetical protein
VVAGLHRLEPAIRGIGAEQRARVIRRQIAIPRRLDHRHRHVRQSVQRRVRRRLASDELLLFGQRDGDHARERGAERPFTSRDDGQTGAA